MGCVFCATGQMGFARNLTSGEIVEQVLYYARHLYKTQERLTNIVIMGMGEPFHNYKATMDAVDRLRDPEGFNFGARRFTLSTVGLAPTIKRFAKEYPQINLAISLHAIDDELRSILVRNELHTLGPLPADEVFAVEISRLLLFLYHSRIHVGPSEDGIHDRVVILLPCPKNTLEKG